MGFLQTGIGQIVMQYEKHADRKADVKTGIRGNGTASALSFRVQQQNFAAQSCACPGNYADRWPDDASDYDRCTSQSCVDGRYPRQRGQACMDLPREMKIRSDQRTDSTASTLAYDKMTTDKDSLKDYDECNLDFLPVVIPQGAASRANRFLSPFARVYAPQLEKYNISLTQFVDFIDGLNEAFIASPAFQAVGIAGRLAGFAPSIIASGVGAAAQIGSRVGSAMTSIGRSRAYLEKANAEIFLPRGLVARFCSTQAMLASLPGGQNISLATKTIDSSLMESIDPRKMYLDRLHGHVAPLTWTVTEQVMPNNWARKMGAWQAQRQEASMMKSYTGSQDPRQQQMNGDGRRSFRDRRRSRSKGSDQPLTQDEILATIKWIVITPHRLQ